MVEKYTEHVDSHSEINPLVEEDVIISIESTLFPFNFQVKLLELTDLSQDIHLESIDVHEKTFPVC